MNAELEILLPSTVSKSEFDALLHLLDDPDSTVTASVRSKLESYGGGVVPALRKALEHEECVAQSTQSREIVLAVIHDFQTQTLERLISMVNDASDSGADIDLEKAITVISKFGYPETDAEAIKERLDAMALRIHALFVKSQNPSELGLLLAVNQAFFEEEGFCAAADGLYHHPDNSYIHVVLNSKTGIPISLSALYILVAERAGVNLYGIGMPAHFVVYHPELDVFIDTFNNGAFLTHNDCKKFIQGAGFVFDPSMLEKVTNLAIILRVIRNLIFAHTKRNEHWEVSVLEEISHTIIEAMNQER